MKILFICHANICRSFLAQEMLKRQLPQAQVFSRGLYVDPYLTVPAKVFSFLVQQGMTPHPHHPTQLTKADLEQADFIFCMEPIQLEMLSDRYAQYIEKMWLVNDFAFGKQTAITDPIALTGKAFTKLASSLQKSVLACAQKLQPLLTQKISRPIVSGDVVKSR